MSFFRIRVAALLRRRPGAECCDCAEQAEFRPDDQLWTIYNGSIVYCPRCAEYEGLY